MKEDVNLHCKTSAKVFLGLSSIVANLNKTMLAHGILI